MADNHRQHDADSGQDAADGTVIQGRGTIMSFIDSLVSHLGDIDIEADALPALVPAVIAAGAMIAFADGAVEPKELKEIDGYGRRYPSRSRPAYVELRPRRGVRP